MELTLFQATLIAGLLMLVCGVALASNRSTINALIKAFPRSRNAAYVTLGVGLAWTLYTVSNLGPADYGNIKNYIFIAFLVIGLGAFRFSPDFLSVRGACIIYLFVADLLLTGAFGHYEAPLRLLMVTPVYIGIALSLYLAYSPFRLRDFFNWLFAVNGRSQRLGFVFFLYGGVVSGIAFAY